MAMQHKQVLTALSFVVGTGFVSDSEAALYDRGNGFVYDDVLNITISKDINLFKTQTASNPNLINNIISEVKTWPDGTPFPPHALNYRKEVDNWTGEITYLGDFNPDKGALSWFGAQAWVSYLNSQNYAGYNNWRLPSASPINGNQFDYSYKFDGTSDYGFNITNQASELAYLFYVELNNLGECSAAVSNYCSPQSGWTGQFNLTFKDAANGNSPDSFNNPPFWLGRYYWTGTESRPDTNTGSLFGAWSFDTGSGFQTPSLKVYQNYALLVRDGDVTPVPVPAAFWLFISGLMSLRFSFRTSKLRPRVI